MNRPMMRTSKDLTGLEINISTQDIAIAMLLTSIPLLLEIVPNIEHPDIDTIQSEKINTVLADR